MDDYDNRFAPGYGTVFTPNSAPDYAQVHEVVRCLSEIVSQEVSASVSRPSYHAIRTGPPIADYRQKKKQRSPKSELGEDLAAMVVLGHA